jgi:hypothetical protein
MKTEVTMPNKELVLQDVEQRTKIESIFNFHKVESVVFTIGDGHYFLQKYTNIAEKHAKENRGTLFAITKEDMKEPIKELPKAKESKKNGEASHID